jgi:hypothetical protein
MGKVGAIKGATPPLAPRVFPDIERADVCRVAQAGGAAVAGHDVSCTLIACESPEEVLLRYACGKTILRDGQQFVFCEQEGGGFPA